MHNCRIRKVANDAAHTVSTWAGSSIGWADGPGATAQFNNPSALAIDPTGQLYTIDTYSRAIRRISIDPAHTVTTLVGGDPTMVGQVDGNGVGARLGAQAGLVLSGNKLYVSDVSSQRIRVVIPGADAVSTTVATFAGSGRVALEDGTGAQAALATPMGLALAPDGCVWVADSGNAAIRRIVP
jgi:streptogramin lyase